MTFPSLFGERLKEARKVIGWSQAEAAEVAGVSREYWGRCERGASIPGGEALSALAQRGYDVLYVLTGERDAPSTSGLTGEERLLVDYYRGASSAVRKAAMAVLLSGVPADMQPASISVSSKHGHAAGRDVNVNTEGAANGKQGNLKPRGARSRA